MGISLGSQANLDPLHDFVTRCSTWSQIAANQRFDIRNPGERLFEIHNVRHAA